LVPALILEGPEPPSEVPEPELDPEPEEDPDPELEPEPEPDPEPELDPDPELEPAPPSAPSSEPWEEELPQAASTPAARRATYGEVRVDLLAMSLLLAKRVAGGSVSGVPGGNFSPTTP
jgi:hypothetical protein